MITHTPYFEVLASVEDETNPEWKPTLAGLVVLRLVDDWLDMGAQVVTTDVTGLRAVRGAIADISEGNPIRSILGGLIDALEQAEVAMMSLVSSHFFAYGQALSYAGQWQLAQHVFTNIRDRAEAAKDQEIMIQATLRLAFLLRRSGDLRAADEAYSFVMQTAETTGDVESYLRGKFGRVGVVVDQGDLPTADLMLDKLTHEVQAHGLTELHGRVLHERAYLSQLQGNMSASVRFGYQALEYISDSVARDRVLAQIALSFAGLGHLQASRDANLILASTAQQQEIRWNALINLMYVAILEEHELAFEQYRCSLEQASLPPRLEAIYRLDVARGFFKFGHPALAQEELSKARQLAENHGSNQLIFEIDTVEVEQAASIKQTKEPHSWPAEIVSIASAIGEWRQFQETVTAKNNEGVVL
jgi:hypothetical protein